VLLSLPCGKSQEKGGRKKKRLETHTNPFCSADKLFHNECSSFFYTSNVTDVKGFISGKKNNKLPEQNQYNINVHLKHTKFKISDFIKNI